jgi:hypothetical protein
MLPIVGEAFAAPSVKQSLIEQEIRLLQADLRARCPDSPALDGFKVYSQVDEDGIIESIWSRIEPRTGTFVELGCGNGTENNSHYLLLKGWCGVWVDGSPQNISHIEASIPLDTSPLLVSRMFITRDNIAVATRLWLERLGGSIDLLSLDIDGNDAAVLAEILKVHAPKVLVLEYNGKFPPPLKISVAYDDKHNWAGDDYYGSSLQVFVDQLGFRYRLVCCGLSGANAYFVRNDFVERFTAYVVADLYMPPRHHLIHRRGGLSSLKHLRNILVRS